MCEEEKQKGKMGMNIVLILGLLNYSSLDVITVEGPERTQIEVTKL